MVTIKSKGQQGIWKPLPDNHIRILHLHRRTFPQTLEGLVGKPFEVRCSLETVSLEDVYNGRVAYTALSYVWSQQRGRNRIFCNNQPVFVTRNLFLALKQIIINGRHMDLWVDSLCINQQDVREKNHQVGMMAQIYRYADLVVAWMGEGRIPFADRTWEEGIRLAQVLDGPRPPPHFRRAWTFQEMVLAPRFILQFGKDEYWDDYVHRPNFPYRRLTRDQMRARERELWYDLDKSKTLAPIRAAKQTRHDFLTLLLLIWEREASNPRDKIYAILGLLEKAAPIDVDYEIPIGALLRRVARSIIDPGTSLELVHIAVNSKSPRELERRSIPTWSPRWDLRGSSFGSIRRDYEHIFDRDIRWNRDGDLIAAGVAFGRVRLVYNQQHDNIISLQTFPRCVTDGRMDLFTIWDAALRTGISGKYLNKSSILELFSSLRKHDRRVCACGERDWSRAVSEPVTFPFYDNRYQNVQDGDWIVHLYGMPCECALRPWNLTWRDPIYSTMASRARFAIVSCPDLSIDEPLINQLPLDVKSTFLNPQWQGPWSPEVLTEKLQKTRRCLSAADKLNWVYGDFILG